jgi:hypothetical protein
MNDGEESSEPQVEDRTMYTNPLFFARLSTRTEPTTRKTDVPVADNDLSVRNTIEELRNKINAAELKPYIDLPSNRLIKKIITVDDGHVKLYCYAVQTDDKKKENTGTKPKQQCIVVDLTRDGDREQSRGYRIYYAWLATPTFDPKEIGQRKAQCVHKFPEGRRPSVSDLYRVVYTIASTEGKWTEKNTCRDFANHVIRMLSTMPLC